MQQDSEQIRSEKSRIEEQIRALYEKREELARLEKTAAKGAKQNGSLAERLALSIRETERMFPKYATVACQGAKGAYSQQAAEQVFAYPNIVYVKTFAAVFAAIEKGLCEYGVLPIENSTAGSVNQIYDLMQAHRFNIVRSVRIKVNHNLLAKPGTEKARITDIYSHPQAIAQCAEYLKQFPFAVVHEVANTAVAAKLVAESPSDTAAALASVHCAQEYPLELLEANVQDRDNNYTRFICISKQLKIFPGANRTSVMAVLTHRRGSLYRILKVLNDYDCNLTKLESRPRQGRDFEFQFYFDFETSVYEPRFAELLTVLQNECEEFEYLGSYEELV